MLALEARRKAFAEILALLDGEIGKFNSSSDPLLAHEVVVLEVLRAKVKALSGE